MFLNCCYVADYTLRIDIITSNWTYHFKDVFARLELDLDDRIEVKNVQKRFKITNDVRFPDNNPIRQSERLNFIAKESNFGIVSSDPNEPKPLRINVKVNYEVDDCPSGKSLLECPMLSPDVSRDVHDHNFKIDLRTGCAQRGRCQCDLKFNLKEPKSSEVRVGEQNSLDLEFEVTNQGNEPAYGVTIVFTSFVDFPIIQGPRGTCKPYNGTNDKGGFMTECSLPKIAKLPNYQTHHSFKFKFPSDFKGENNFNLSPELKHSCNGKNNSEMLTNQQNRLFQLKFETKIELTSSVSSSQIL